MIGIDWPMDVVLPALVSAVTTLIGYLTLVSTWIEKRMQFKYDQLLRNQQHAHDAQLEMFRMLPQGLAKIQELVLTPATTVRNRLRAVHREEVEPGEVTDQVGAAAEKLRDALECARDSFLIFGVLEQAHAIKNCVTGISGDLKDGTIKLEQKDHELGLAVNEMTELISAMQDRIQLWIPSPPETLTGVNEL